MFGSRSRPRCWRPTPPNIRPRPTEYKRILAGELPDGWETALPTFVAKADATRNTCGKVINALASVIPNLIGGSADLAGSNKTTINGKPFVRPGDFDGPNFNFGVREHGMGAILNGMALHGGIIPYGAHLPGLQRLHAAKHPPGRIDGCARHLRLHARQHWPGRRRPHAPAHRAPRRAARRFPT